MTIELNEDIPNTHDFTIQLTDPDDGFILLNHKSDDEFLGVTYFGDVFQYLYQDSITPPDVTFLGNFVVSANSQLEGTVSRVNWVGTNKINYGTVNFEGIGTRFFTSHSNGDVDCLDTNLNENLGCDIGAYLASPPKTCQFCDASCDDCWNTSTQCREGCEYTHIWDGIS